MDDPAVLGMMVALLALIGAFAGVLAGLLGGLLAQQPENVFEMASLAVFVHGYAAEAARDELGETGMRATDISDRLGYFSR